MSTWAEKLKEKTAPPPTEERKSDHEPTAISPEKEKTPVEAAAEPVVAEPVVADPLPSEKPTDDASQEQPKLSYVDLGPVTLPAELVSFISEEFTFGEASAMPSTEVPVAPEPSAAPQGPSKLDDSTAPSNPPCPPVNETNRRPPQRRQPQRGRSTNPNAIPYGGNRYTSQKNPYYINNGFGDALIQYNLRHQALPHHHHHDSHPDYPLHGVDPSQTPSMYHPNDVSALPHPHFLDSNAIAYRPSYMLHSGLYYSGQLQPWPPYYPPPTEE